MILTALNHFTETTAFFARESFDGADLFDLIVTIDKTYLNHKIHLKAKSLIK